MELKGIYQYRNRIEEVIKDSIAEELGIRPNDVLISINGNKVKDIIDYKYLISDEYIEVEICKKNGEIWVLKIEKEFDEDIGIIFTNPLIDRAKTCRNKCIFCFIDQLPPKMRETLYFKDDDSRLSFLQGNFITLTNMSRDEIERIIKYRLSPVNVSVHTTNPQLRVRMLNNKRAGEILNILNEFKGGGIKVNCQIVLVPGVNDGKELERTLMDLSGLYPFVESVAVVPVGLTRFRDNLPQILPYNKESSLDLLDFIEQEQSKYIGSIGTRFVFASDEFYAITGKALPAYESYEGFPQLENGVGLMKTFEQEIDEGLKGIKEVRSLKSRLMIITGVLAENYMNKIKGKILDKYINMELDIIAIENNFFGESITVSGLITGQDIIEQMGAYNIKNVDGLIIPKSMLRADTSIFLDDLTLGDLGDRLGKEIYPVAVSGHKLISLIQGLR